MTRKEKLLGFLENQAKIPYKPREIAVMIGAENNLSELYDILSELEKEGKVIKGKNGRYEAVRGQGIFYGKFRLNNKGFGFVDCGEEGFFISSENRGTALDGDFVRIRQTAGGKHGREGKIIEVINRAAETVTGHYIGGKVFLSAPPHEIVIDEPSKSFENCRVIAKINDYENLRGEVIVNLGMFESPESEMLGIMHEHSISENFPQEVLREAEKAALMTADTEQRRDLRSLLTVTIDGADARDLDDAVSLEDSDDGAVLYVHIADVSHFVKYGDKIDREAFSRGTSCYFPDRVCPMLPQLLSNGVCSLNPDADRLAVTTAMKISSDGCVRSYEVFESVIRSDFRLVYEDVTEMLENENSRLWKKYEKIRSMLYSMERLARRLRKRRFEKGSIDFNIPEPRIILDSMGNTADVVTEKHTVSHRIIEEFMLACNRTLAEHACLSGIPFIYRVHEEPDSDKMNEFRKFIGLFGFSITGRATGKRLMDILDKSAGQSFEKAVNTVLLRSMAKARYDAQNKGHFGLGAEFYCHFTSPIRRYPDLVCHRMIKMSLRGKNYDDNTIKFTVEAALKASEREIEAAEAEREAVKLKICEYMQGHIGEEFEAVISSVASFGFFAELDNCIEGLVRLEDLNDDYYEFNENTLSLVGKRRGKTYSIGDRVRVVTAKVDREERYIDFILGGHKWK